MLDIDLLTRQLGYDAESAGDLDSIEKWTEQHLRLGDWWTSPTGESLQVRMIYRPDRAALLGEGTNRCIIDLEELRSEWTAKAANPLLLDRKRTVAVDWGRHP